MVNPRDIAGERRRRRRYVNSQANAAVEITTVHLLLVLLELFIAFFLSKNLDPIFSA